MILDIVSLVYKCYNILVTRPWRPDDVELRAVPTENPRCSTFDRNVSSAQLNSYTSSPIPATATCPSNHSMTATSPSIENKSARRKCGLPCIRSGACSNT